MKLGLMVEYAARGMDLPIERIKRCEALGYDSVWTAEAYGTDAITPLAFIAAHTKRIRLATGVIQLSARTPAMTAMQLGTLDALAGGGRVIGGLGVSGPQIVEGWYGVPWGSPLEKMRDYVAILEKIFAREGPVTHDGKEIQLPFMGEGSAEMGKPLKSILHFAHKPKIFLGQFFLEKFFLERYFLSEGSLMILYSKQFRNSRLKITNFSRFQKLGFFFLRHPIDLKKYIDRVWHSSYRENCLEVPKTFY